MMDTNTDYFPIIAKKLEHFKKVVTLDKFGQQQLLEIIKYLVDDKSIEQHRGAWAWFTFLYNSYGGRYPTVRAYVDKLKEDIGYYTKREKDFIIEGQKVRFIKMILGPFSPQKCSRKVFSDCLKKISDWTYEKYGITMDQYLDADWNKKDQCQYPTCHNKWTDTHEIFGGHGVRKEYSIKNGWQVHTCRGHHDLSGSINNGLTPDRLMPGMKEKMARIWCGVKRINFRKCLNEIRKVAK